MRVWKAGGLAGRCRVALACLVAVLLVAIGLTFRSYGISFDEPLQQTYGEGVLRYLLTGGKDRAYAFAFSNLYLYGGLFEAAAALWARLLPGLDLYDARHLFNALVGAFGIVGAYALGSRSAGPRAGWWSALLLAFTPTWLGHSFFNSKDIPFAVGYLWSVAAILRAHREYPRARLSTALLVGLAMGCTMGVRVGGLILWGMLGLSLAIWLLRCWVGHPARRRATLRSLPRLAALTLLSLAVSYGVMLAAWPWAQAAPLTRPFESLAKFSRFSGQPSSRDALIWHLATYSAKLPELIWLLAAAGAVSATALFVRNRRRRLSARAGQLALLAAAAVVPVVYFVFKRATIYNEVRHLLFVQAVLVVIAGCAAADLIRRLRCRPAARTGLVLLLTAGLFSLALTVARLFPYQYVYYNAVSGGLRAAERRGLTLDYWDISYREAAAWVAQRALLEGATPERPVAVQAIKPEECASHYYPPWLQPVREGGVFTIMIADRRQGLPEKAPGEIVHRIERDGVTLGVVKRTTSSVLPDPPH